MILLKLPLFQSSTLQVRSKTILLFPLFDTLIEIHHRNRGLECFFILRFIFRSFVPMEAQGNTRCGDVRFLLENPLYPSSRKPKTAHSLARCRRIGTIPIRTSPTGTYPGPATGPQGVAYFLSHLIGTTEPETEKSKKNVSIESKFASLFIEIRGAYGGRICCFVSFFFLLFCEWDTHLAQVLHLFFARSWFAFCRCVRRASGGNMFPHNETHKSARNSARHRHVGIHISILQKSDRFPPVFDGLICINRCFLRERVLASDGRLNFVMVVKYFVGLFFDIARISAFNEITRNLMYEL